MDLRAAKANLRSAIKNRLARLSHHNRAAESRSLCRRILESLPTDHSTIAAYYPLNDEADIRPVLTELLERNFSVFIPRTEGSHMVLRQMTSLNDLQIGTFGILEPPETAPLLPPEELTVMLVPGRAFDRKGNRLGRGNGGYDIWIRKQRNLNPKTKFWGVTLECQITHEIPMEEHDEKLDAIVTARGILNV